MALETYRYRARLSDGTSVRGSLQAQDAASVIDFLRARSLVVTAVAGEQSAAGRVRRALRLGATPRVELLTFFRSFVTLLRAGVALQRALTITIERARTPELAEALRSILASVEGGLPLSDAMGSHPRDFPSLYVAMIRAGETGGILDDVLERLALLLERETALAGKLRAALAYPAIVVFAASLLVIFLMAKIVPMFAQLFASFHVDLPPATKLLVLLGTALAAPLPWLLIGGATALTAFTVGRFARTPAGGLTLDRVRLRLPIVGPLLHKAITARVARLLATLLRSGVELTAAIEAIVPVTGSARYARAFAQVNRALRGGEPFAHALTAACLFDPMVLALIRVGEETGSIDTMLLKLAEYFERDVEAAIATLGAVLEPVIIVVLGGVVGFLVLSIFLPLYSLIGSVAP